MRVVGVQEWAGGLPVRVREAVFHTDGSYAIKYAWGNLLACSRSSAIRAFQAQVFAYYRLGSGPPPAAA